MTSRQDFIAPITIRNVQKHYPEIFKQEQIHFANHWIDAADHQHYHGRGIISKSKAQLCKEAKAVLLIDDNLDYARDVSKHGLLAMLFDLNGTYMWNKCSDRDLPKNTIRCRSWEEIVALLCPSEDTQEAVTLS